MELFILRCKLVNEGLKLVIYQCGSGKYFLSFPIFLSILITSGPFGIILMWI